MPDKTFRRAKDLLQNLNLVTKVNSRYSRATVTTVTPAGQSTVQYRQGSLSDPDDCTNDGNGYEEAVIDLWESEDDAPQTSEEFLTGVA